MSSNQHIPQDRQIDLSQLQSQYQRAGQMPGHSQVPQGNVGSNHDEYSFEVEINQPDVAQQRQIPQYKMKQTKSSSTYITPLKQKDSIQNSMKDMRKYLLFINNTDWMFQNEQSPVDNYLKN